MYFVTGTEYSCEGVLRKWKHKKLDDMTKEELITLLQKFAKKESEWRDWWEAKTKSPDSIHD